jgi:hypothetical protein
MIKSGREGATHMKRMRNAHKMLVGRPEGNTPLGKPRHRSKYIIKRSTGKKYSPNFL